MAKKKPAKTRNENTIKAPKTSAPPAVKGKGLNPPKRNPRGPMF